jgi:hypothetical protein
MSHMNHRPGPDPDPGPQPPPVPDPGQRPDLPPVPDDVPEDEGMDGDLPRHRRERIYAAAAASDHHLLPHARFSKPA